MRMCSDRIRKMQSAAELAEALRLGGRRGNHEPFGIKRHSFNDVLKNWTYQLPEFEIGAGPWAVCGIWRSG
jgi:hypothetical protein